MNETRDEHEARYCHHCDNWHEGEHREEMEKSKVEATLHEIAVLIRSLEGMPVEFRMAKKLSELLRMIGPRIAGSEKEPDDPPGWEGGFAENH